MDPHYFLSKSDLLNWINDTLGMRLTKIEETANGAVACQLMDALHPGVVPIKKVDFNAKNEYDMINNYKVLQEVFTKMNVAKHVEVSKLIKGRPLDNIEFMQWAKSYFDSVTNGAPVSNYDGPSRRATSKTGDVKGASGPAPKLSNMRQAGDGAARVSGPGAGVAPRKPLAPSGTNVASPAGKAAAGSELAAQLAEMRSRAEAFEKEKDFYYSKLRDIELLCQTPTICEIPIMKKVEAILYAPTAEEGRQLLMDAQLELAGQVFLGEDEAAAADA
mmetsp:Transcript_13995/g.30263  ORF Transcript_13995/g.30263 Transcript_13995/m.30263 type:complete len:275 (+) Transcript_13995:190-1014(+)|eukprot:CAMPEP_0202901926 /NCGR_PEP_ID=MMETSP1392-20130828/15363_1 /ASSEMBLY_ACC=CAM_ASM_000868 /TAXON_ID=225041 /ORGANISM="Chlamydomonas chlamydogama, Strain SAG 11-48b" /LENGTH=274 /DNA_ID=CAMNT_0049588587 /DNA_START=182 /DNA_END=1006 /DNA_ORIENTATION=+